MNLRELSEKLGLSQTTVSRALNGYPEVSDATRRRVVEAAAQHNYRPSSRAKSLATGRSMAIAHVIPVPARHEMVNPVFADFIAGASDVYAQSGYDMLLSVADDGDEEAIYRDLASRRSVDGVIVHAPRVDDARLQLLLSLGLPFVVHGRFGNATEGYSWLDMNNRRAFARATRFLTDLGHRRIALVNGVADMDFAARRADGYSGALDDVGIAADTALLLHGEMTEHHGYRSAHDLLAGVDPPTAFLASSLIIAIGIRRACEEAGLTLGRDVSLVTHDDDLSYFRNGTDEAIYTALRSPVREHGTLCARMLLQLVADPGTTPMTRLLEAELRVGHTTGPAPRDR
ncbi:LacI family DNA-binding transcriptional regulator [Tranquillimonas rosea]|uniref:LacI family DNA-binding transcriptional regulator n=1 Tax=Tranquillimonas rosea TaxID=641238 RepID=UPI003BABBD85